MLIKRPIPAPDTGGSEARKLEIQDDLIVVYSMFFDDCSAVMYRKIDTTPLFATFLKLQCPTEAKAVGIDSDSLGSLADRATGRVMSSLIPSRMTHRLLFAPAGAPSERMTP